MSLLNQSLSTLQTLLDKKEIKPTELLEESLAAISRVDGQIRAFLTVDEEGARAAAAGLDRELASGNGMRGPLFGLPAGIKDNISTEGLRTTCASRFLEKFVPVYDATVMSRLKAAQAVTVGKLNMDEFAMGSSNETSAFFITRNPWNPEHVPGGSSGGSAAAVAAGEVYFALGSDTGGSIRQPASYCGVVGLKPTYGLVSRYGLVAFASSLDQIGPLTKNVEDAAQVLQAIAGYDPMDSTSANVAVPDYRRALTGDIRGLRIAVPREYMGEGVAEDVRTRVREALRVFESLGAAVEEVSMPHTEYATAAYYIIACSEASSNLSRFDGVRYGRRAAAGSLEELYVKSRDEGFGQEVKRRIMLGTFALSSGYFDAYYLKAQRVRTLVKRDFEQVFEKYDLIAGPTTPTTAFRIGEMTEDPLTMYLNDILTIPVNLAGVPAISVPCGFSGGLPVGLQLIGKPFGEAELLKAAHAYQQSTDHHLKRPQLALEGGGAR